MGMLIFQINSRILLCFGSLDYNTSLCCLSLTYGTEEEEDLCQEAFCFQVSIHPILAKRYLSEVL